MWSTGTGSEVMRRIAAPMVGGMVSSTVLTLIVIPALYALVKTPCGQAGPGAGSEAAHTASTARRQFFASVFSGVRGAAVRGNTGRAMCV
mgnify:CR=1 FL=1